MDSYSYSCCRLSADSSLCHSQPRKLSGSRNLSMLLMFAMSRAHDETNTAVRIRRVPQNRFQKIRVVAALSFSFDAVDNSASKRARSRRRLGMRGAARMQRASRNLRSSLLRLAKYTMHPSNERPEVPTMPRDYIPRNSRVAQSRTGFWRDNRACIRVTQSQKLRQFAAATEKCIPPDFRFSVGHRTGSGALPRSGECAALVSWTNR